MRPIYRDDFAPWVDCDMLRSIPWVQRTSARQECFMSGVGEVSYTYGGGQNARTYKSIPLLPWVRTLMRRLGEDYNVCFLNLYENHRKHLGWHADDSPEMDQNHPIAVVSYGEEREIWWREKGRKGATPPENRQLLRNGSLFVMPAGFQQLFNHKIPKGDREMGERISLTFRRLDRRQDEG